MSIPTLNEILAWLPAILAGITFHEYAHGKVAELLGDNTPRSQGRLTLNPISHIDPVGFIMLLIVHFGWAKPVLVNPRNFKNVSFKTGMLLVSLAGPAMNLILALISMYILKYAINMPDSSSRDLIMMIMWPVVEINLILAAFNLIPLPPLDGSKILAGLLPDSGARLVYSLEPYGPLILLLLIATGATRVVIIPIINYLYNILCLIVF